MNLNLILIVYKKIKRSKERLVGRSFFIFSYAMNYGVDYILTYLSLFVGIIFLIYTLTITYVNTGEDQSINVGKTFSGQLQVKQTTK